MKAYTDINQSKKLAGILPLESADMSWVSNGLGKPFARTIPIKGDPEELCACWSLAALLSVLPDHFYNETGRKTLGMDKGDIYYNVFYETKYSYIQKSANNPVDACYEMLLKLYELNLL